MSSLEMKLKALSEASAFIKRPSEPEDWRECEAARAEQRNLILLKTAQRATTSLSGPKPSECGM